MCELAKGSTSILLTAAKAQGMTRERSLPGLFQKANAMLSLALIAAALALVCLGWPLLRDCLYFITSK